MAVKVADEGKMKNNKVIAMLMVGFAAIALTSCGEEQTTTKMEDQSKTNQYWLELSKHTEAKLEIETIYPGVNVLGVDLGGKTQTEAKVMIEQELNDQILAHEVVLTHEDQEWTFSFEELGVSADAEEIAGRAFNVGRSGDLRQREQFVDGLLLEKEDMQIDIAFDEEKLIEIVEGLCGEVKQEAVDAQLSRENGKFVITPEENGLELDIEMTVKDIQAALQNGENDQRISLSIKEVKPDITEELLKNVKDMIGSGSTYYSTSNANREQNLIVGASKLNGMLVMPNETVSFNTMVAPITEANGYKPANVIQGDEYVLDLGGGLCQVSTTLYNAVIRAELEVLERDCHAFPSDYVPMGLDAAVAQGYIDFRFCNDTGYPIYISMWCGGGEIGAAIYGKEIHDESRKVSFDYVITEVIEKPKAKEVEDPKLKPGERVVEVEGHTGYTVDTYKTVTEKGESYTEWFSTSYYFASADKVRVGPKKQENNNSGSKPTKPAEPEESKKTEESSGAAQESTSQQESSVPQESTTQQDSVTEHDSLPQVEQTDSSAGTTPNQESEG